MTITYGGIRAQITRANETIEPSVVQIRLKERSVMSLLPSRSETVVRCWSGRLWVTQEGDRNDHFLAPGDIFPVRRSGRIVLEAMEEASIGILSSRS